MNLRRDLPLCLLVFSFFISASAFSQEWRISQILYGNDSISFAALRYNRADNGVAVIDSKARIKWELPVPGYIIGMSKWKENLLVFYTVSANIHRFPRIKTIHEITVGLKQRNQLSDNIVFTNSSTRVVFPELLNDPRGDFNFLLVRTSGYKAGGFARVAVGIDEKESRTARLSVVTLDDAGNAVSTEVNSAALTGKYLISCTSPEKDLYLASFADGKLYMEEFDRSLKLVTTLSTTLNLRDKPGYLSTISCDTSAKNTIDLALYYENSEKGFNNGLYRFDFSAKKVVAAPEIHLTKEYIQGMENHAAGSDFSSLKTINQLKPVAILETTDKIIVIKEIQYIFTTANQNHLIDRYTHEGGLIEIYSKDLKLLHDFALGKYVETFIQTGYDIGLHIVHDKLFVVSCEGGGIGSYSDYLYIIGVADYSFLRKSLKRTAAGKGMFMEARNVIWNTRNFITPVVSAAEFFKTKYRTSLQKYTYDQELN